MATVTSPYYCPFVWKCQATYTQLDLQLFMAVHLIGCGSVPVLCSPHPWEAPGWQVIAIGADVKQVTTSYLQTLDNSVFTLEYKPWYHFGANAKVVVMTTLRSDVYHLLHVCHVLIEVTITFWCESVCYRVFWKFFLYTFSLSRCIHKYWVFWMVGCVSFVDIFTMNYLF